MIINKLLFTLTVLCLAPTLAADVLEKSESNFEITVEALTKRSPLINFNVKDKLYALVRSTVEDMQGFRLKDARKPAEERRAFANQFGLNCSLPLLSIYQLASTHPNFKSYLMGLYSIYALDTNKKGTFVGELIIDERDLSESGMLEIGYDIDITMRRKGIALEAIGAVVKQIINIHLGKEMFVFDHEAAQSRVKATFQKAIQKSRKPLATVKSKVSFDNYPSLRLQEKSGFSPLKFSVDYSVVYVYPPQESHISSTAIPYLKMLTNENKDERQKGIQVLRHSIDRLTSPAPGSSNY